MISTTLRSNVFASLVVALLGHSVALADECSHLWKAELQTGTNVTRGMSGDTNAAYALLSFRPEQSLTLILDGAWPNARFFSFESYKSRLLTKDSALLDHQIRTYIPHATNSGDILPPNAHRFQIEASVDGPHFPQSANFLKLPFSLIQPQAIMWRLYDPAQQLTSADLPRVYAVDSRTGAPRRCPTPVDIAFRFDGPQLIGALAPFSRNLNFGTSSVMSGQNSAIPGYAFVLTQMHTENAAFIRFRTPRARYFSLCVQDFLDNTTLGCLADRNMHHDQNGFTYVAVSENLRFLEQARLAGWNPLTFRRSNNQRVIGFVYRQILPDSSAPYAGDQMPVGTVCSETEFMQRTCP